MKGLFDWVKIVAAVGLLVGLVVVVWKFKWYILLGSVCITVLIMLCNVVYKRATGRDMAIYTRIIK